MGVKRGYPFASVYPAKEARYSSGLYSVQLSSIEQLVSRQLQRNEMDGIDQQRLSVEPPYQQNVGTK